MSDLQDAMTAMRSLVEALADGTAPDGASLELAAVFENVDAELRGGTRRPPQSMCGNGYTLEPDTSGEPEILYCGLQPGHAGPFHIGLFWWYTDEPAPDGKFLNG